MAAQPVVEVEGAKELRKALKNAEGDLADFKEAHVKVAEFVIGYADTNGFTPVKTGALQSTQRAQNTGASAGIRVGGKSKATKADVFYARMVYDGTRRSRANPWLHNAATASQDEWTAIYNDAVEDILAKAVRGLS